MDQFMGYPSKSRLSSILNFLGTILWAASLVLLLKITFSQSAFNSVACVNIFFIILLLKFGRKL